MTTHLRYSSIIKRGDANDSKQVQDEIFESNAKCSHLSVNVGYTGGLPLSSIGFVDSALDCRQLCAEEEGCKAWTYVTGGFVRLQNCHDFALQ